MEENIKPLKVASLDNIAKVNRNSYLVNEESKTAIEISKKAYSALKKMDNSERGGLAADTLAMSIAYRRESDVTDALNNWINYTLKDYYYPPGRVNTAFSKYLRTTLLSPLMDNYFTHDEIEDLIRFFAKCPHGYKFYNEFIAVHSELSPIIT